MYALQAGNGMWVKEGIEQVRLTTDYERAARFDTQAAAGLGRALVALQGVVTRVVRL